jgi:hypothetical protein
MGTGGSFPGGKTWPGGDADHSPLLVPRSRKSRRCTYSYPKHLHGTSRDFTFVFVVEEVWCKIHMLFKRVKFDMKWK